MHSTESSSAPPRAMPRRIFFVLSPRALSYGRHALKSLVENALDPLHISLITDSEEDKQRLIEEMTACSSRAAQAVPDHGWTAYGKLDLDARAESLFSSYPALRQFRNGHPCWRKITDPILLTAAGEEMVVSDPDVYFPNRFRFEPTPERGLLLMWQKPNCLLPPSVVSCALEAGIPLANHVDIGIAHWRAPVDLDWLEWLLVQLDANRPELRYIPHIEAIVWAAIAMRLGGGYLPAEAWHCRYRSQTERVLGKLGVPKQRLLQLKGLPAMKCFHAGGDAKSWLPDAVEQGRFRSNETLSAVHDPMPFIELTPKLYDRQQSLKRWLRRCGYYRIFAPEGT